MKEEITNLIRTSEAVGPLLGNAFTEKGGIT